MRTFYEVKNDKKLIFEKRMQIGSILETIIKDRLITKTQFAKNSGISRQTLNNIINSKIDKPTTLEKHVYKILGYLNMTLEQLINYESFIKLDINDMGNLQDKLVFPYITPKEHTISNNTIELLKILQNVIEFYDIY